MLEQVPVYQQQQQQPLYQTVGQPIPTTETQPTYTQAPAYGYPQQSYPANYGYPQQMYPQPYQYPGAAAPAPAAPSSAGPPASQYTGPGGYSVMPGDDDNISA